MPWHLLRVQHTQALRSELADRYAASTANKMLAALRGALRAAWELGQIETGLPQRSGQKEDSGPLLWGSPVSHKPHV